MLTLFAAPTTVAQARRQANIFARAKTLFSAGYTTERVVISSGPYHRVTNPQGEEYIVDLLLQRCTCAGFENDGDCKHRIAVVMMEEADENRHYDEMAAQYYGDPADNFPAFNWGITY